MKFDYIFIAIMFPAIPLMMSVFSNRFHTLSVLIRTIHDNYILEKNPPENLRKQLLILESRVVYLRRAQLLMGFSFLFNMFSVFSLFLQLELSAKILFVICLVSIICALIIYLYEITLSSKALKFHLSDLDLEKRDL